jgi:hypothetical protein
MGLLLGLMENKSPSRGQGHRISSAKRRQIVRMLCADQRQNPEYPTPDRTLAERAGVDKKTIWRMRSELESRGPLRPSYRRPGPKRREISYGDNGPPIRVQSIEEFARNVSGVSDGWREPRGDFIESVSNDVEKAVEALLGHEEEWVSVVVTVTNGGLVVQSEAEIPRRDVDSGGARAVRTAIKDLADEM